MKRYLLVLQLLFFFSSCHTSEEHLFNTASLRKTGITFENTLHETDSLNIQSYLYFYNGGGVAIGDINNDNLPDIFFSGNQVKNKLYLNKGQLEFEDISESAGVNGNSSWNTGAVMADINGDGLLDVYVLAVVGIHGFKGYNELYINNGDLSFRERAGEYGLDFENFSTSAAFLDYDLDGDPDLYLLNHAVHTQQSLDYVDMRLKRDARTGDKLLRNDNGHFTDVSEDANIYGGPNGYGLGVAVSDFNNDGWPDLYVSNDFQEDDYYYLNDQNGGFTEQGRQAFGQLSRFSMGNDVADINQDGWPDLITLDMLPENEKVLKASESDDNVQTELLRTQEYGYQHQFSRNMLQVSQKGNGFSETALLSDISATDWSWSALFADYDQNGRQDLFISNGIVKRPNDLDYINYYSTLHFIKNGKNAIALDRKGLEMMPSGAVPNKIFEGKNDLRFEDKSGSWIGDEPSVSGATAMGDLDNDGDIDLVVNNINGPPTLYINRTDTNANYLKLRFDYTTNNRFGVGTKVLSYHKGVRQYKEMYSARGFQASSEPILHFGYGKNETVDSLKIIWPDGTSQNIENQAVNQTLTISPENTRSFNYSDLSTLKLPWFEKMETNLGIDFKPVVSNLSDFNRHRLLPYTVANDSPVVGIGDLDDDSKADIVVQDFKNMFLQKDTIYKKQELTKFGLSPKQLEAITIADFDQDGKNDLLYVIENRTGKNEGSLALKGTSGFEETALPDCFENSPVLVPSDFDQDGDLDLFVGNRSVSNDFGKLPDSFVLEKRDGKFHINPNEALEQLGMVKDAVWDDFDGDGTKDLIVVGEWMSPKFLKNTKGRLSEVEVLKENYNGLWQSIIPFDIDNDGDTDYLLGNWGLNSKFKASRNFPLQMYYSDFDDNGATETVIATEKNGNYYPLESFAELSGQLVNLRKKFTSYSDFAGKTMEDIFGTSVLNSAKLLTVNELASGYLENREGNFEFKAFGSELQTAPITKFLKFDFNRNGTEEVLAAGNFFGLKPFHGRLGSFSGALILNDGGIKPGNLVGLDLMNKEIGDIKIVHIGNKPILIVIYKNYPLEVYSLPKYSKNNSARP